MSRLRRITGDEAVRAFERAGFQQVRTKGSHKVLAKDGHDLHFSIPCHKGKILGIGLLTKKIKEAGLSVEEFIDYL